MDNNDYPTDDQNDRSRRYVHRLEYCMVGLASLLIGFFIGISLEDKKGNERLADEIMAKDDCMVTNNELNTELDQQDAELVTDQGKIHALSFTVEREVNNRGLQNLTEEADNMLYDAESNKLMIGSGYGPIGHGYEDLNVDIVNFTSDSPATVTLRF